MKVRLSHRSSVNLSCEKEEVESEVGKIICTIGKGLYCPFFVADDGKVLSMVNVGREAVKTVLTWEMQVFKSSVREMLFLGGSPPKLLVGSDQSLKLMNVRQCFTSSIKSCR